MIRAAILIALLAALIPSPVAGVASVVAVVIQSSDIAVIAALIGAVLGPILTFLIAARRFSGRIATTEASDLWAESRAIRDWSLQRIEILNGVVSRLEDRCDKLENENAVLHAEVNTLRAANEELRTRLDNDVH